MRRGEIERDPGRLQARLPGLVDAWRPGCRVTGLRALVGGKSSLTYRVELGDEEPVVVKMAPPGLAPTRNRDVLRQARVQEAIVRSGCAPVAPVCFVDPGEPPEVPPLYAMEFVEGESFEPLLDACAVLPAPSTIRGRQLAAARALGGLHSVAPGTVGLADEPEIGLVEEVDRWVRMFETVTDDLRPGFRDAADALLAEIPASVPSTIVHGEYRLGNVLARGDDVVAIIDWELWSREDPRVDLSWFLSYVDADEQPSAIRPTPDGMPKRGDLVAAYEAAVRHPVADMAWFDAHARFKMGAIAAVINKHNRRREQPDPDQEALVPVIGRLVQQSMQILEHSPTRR